MFKFLRMTFTASVLAASLAAAGPTGASELCVRLNAELAAMSESYSAPAKVRKYARAIAEQKLSLRQLAQQMRETGCSGGSLFVVGGEQAEECSLLEEKRGRMETNLAILNEKRLALMTGQEEDDRRRRLLAAIEDNRCSDQLASRADSLAQSGADKGDLRTGYETIRVPQSEDYGDSRFVHLGGSATNGSFRTMCVRTCDGAFFPISSQASPISFRRDAQVCSMMCPGVETELFYHSIHAESSSMRSAVTGRAYDDLDGAYRFRTRSRSDDQACRCNFALYHKEMMRREAYIANPSRKEARQSSIVWVKPEFRAQLNREEPIARPRKEAALRQYTPDPAIRQIGPKFLPDQETFDFRRPSPVAHP